MRWSAPIGISPPNPASGANRYANELGLPGLKVWPLRRYPYLVFYVDADSHIDVWRLLHAERDIPAWMRELDGDRDDAG